MEDKVQEFLKKYEINPYAEDCFAMEEKLLSVPVEEFSDEVLEFLISNEIGITGLAHLDFPEKWLIRFMKYDSMAANSFAPLEILNMLTEVKDIKGAKSIRVAAKKTIQKKNLYQYRFLEEMYDSSGYCERQYYSKVRKETSIGFG